MKQLKVEDYLDVMKKDWYSEAGIYTIEYIDDDGYTVHAMFDNEDNLIVEVYRN